MKVLVTGGAGFIGSHIADRLVSEGHDVVVVDSLTAGSRANVNTGCKFIQADVTAPTLPGIFEREQPEIVFHHAAQIDVQKSVADSFSDARNNILGTLNLLNCCVRFRAKKIIYASSAAVYGSPRYLPIDEKHPVCPVSNYGISKHTPEHYLKVYRDLHGLNYTVLRYANVFGPRQGTKGEGGVICIFANRLLADQPPVIYGDGSQTRDFVYVDDVVDANLCAIDCGDGEVLNIGSGVQVSVNELFDRLKQAADLSMNAVYAEPRPGDIEHSVFDVSLAREVLGWRPQWSLEDGLRKTIEYYKNNK